MKKRSIIVLLILGFMFFGAALSSAKESNSEQEYMAEVNYPGFYVNNRVYILNSVDQTWYPDDRKWVKAFNCQRARLDLESLGFWVGNLDNDGRCDGDDEAPQRATGNYLNYLVSKDSSATQSRE